MLGKKLMAISYMIESGAAPSRYEIIINPDGYSKGHSQYSIKIDSYSRDNITFSLSENIPSSAGYFPAIEQKKSTFSYMFVGDIMKKVFSQAKEQEKSRHEKKMKILNEAEKSFLKSGLGE